MGTIVIKKDGKEVARFENETSDIKAVKYLHDHSPGSNQWAIMHEGWSYDMIEDDGTVVTVDKDYLLRLDKEIEDKRRREAVYLESIQENINLSEDEKLRRLRAAKEGTWYDGWRPYCTACSTMDRMDKRSYGFLCEKCGNMIGWNLTRLKESPLNKR